MAIIGPYGYFVDENKKDSGGQISNAPEAAEPKQPEKSATGTARILARAGEAFDVAKAGRAMHESGLKDASRLEPTDQTFVFAAPGEKKSTYVHDDETLHSAEPVLPGVAGRAHAANEAAQLAVDVTGTPVPGISWRARSLAPGGGPVRTGVLQEESAPDTASRSLLETEFGLFAATDDCRHEEGALPEGSDLVLGVKHREYGSVYFFRAGQKRIKAGDKVLVESEYGLSLAEVISARRMRLPLPKIRTIEGEELDIKPILGLPRPEDIAAAADNKILAAGARLFCKECIRERQLDMKLVDVEVLHDRSKIIFYFTAPTRIDFRELVKDLVRNYRTRIELRQIGVRHETQMLGALGNCGMACCCRRYLRRFAPVTIKMAKEQNLFLNPAKLSGICGRLLCCLANEQENYEEFHHNCPKVGKKYKTTRGVMKVLRVNLFRQSIMAVDEVGGEEEFLLDSWHALEPQRLEAREHRDESPAARSDEAPDSDLEGMPRGDASGGDVGQSGGADELGESDETSLAGLLDNYASLPGQEGDERPEQSYRNECGRLAVRPERPDGERYAERVSGKGPEKASDNSSGKSPGKSIFGLPGSNQKNSKA